MTSNNLEKARGHLLAKFRSIAESINSHALNNDYQLEVFFSGRDEDFLMISFKCKFQLIEISIALINHNYKLTGRENVNCRCFKIENSQFKEVAVNSFAFPESGEKIFKAPIDLIIERIKQGLQHISSAGDH